MRAAGPLLAAAAAAFAAPGLAAGEAPGAVASLLAPALNVADPARELAFYRDGLGMILATTRKVSTGTEYILGFAGAGVDQPGLILQDHPAQRSALVPGTAFNRLVLRATDLAGTAARLERLGYAHDPIRNVAKGYRVMTLRDPDGYRIELVERAPRK